MKWSAAHASLKQGLAKAALIALGLVYGGGAFAALPIERWQTPSGAQVLFMRAAAIPMVDVQVDFDAGGRRAPSERLGVAGLTASLMGKGAGDLDENALNDGFADTGAVYGGGSAMDRASFSLRTLTSKPEFDRATQLFALILQKPRFDPQVLERQKQISIAGIRDALTKPEAIANKAFMQAAYGEHPYGRSATEQTVAAITREDIQRFYAGHYSAKRATVSIVGDLTRPQAEALAAQLTTGLPDAPEPAALPEPVPPKGQDIRIAHPAAQSHVLIGMPALKRGDPDFFALTVGNYVLGGGGFVSRLMNEVREKRGLAYSAYSYFQPAAQLGMFEMGLQTKKEQTDQALSVAKDVLNRFLDQGPTEAELKAAKQNLVGGFPLRIDSNKKLLDQLSVIGFYRLPSDYLDQWTEHVERVTVAQIREAFARKLQRERLVTVVVGQGS